jgi:hypothetical protein
VNLVIVAGAGMALLIRSGIGIAPVIRCHFVVGTMISIREFAGGFPRSEIGALKDPPDGLMICILDLGVFSRDSLNEIECVFSGDLLKSASFFFNFFNG